MEQIQQSELQGKSLPELRDIQKSLREARDAATTVETTEEQEVAREEIVSLKARATRRPLTPESQKRLDELLDGRARAMQERDSKRNEIKGHIRIVGRLISDKSRLELVEKYSSMTTDNIHQRAASLNAQVQAARSELKAMGFIISQRAEEERAKNLLMGMGPQERAALLDAAKKLEEEENKKA